MYSLEELTRLVRDGKVEEAKNKLSEMQNSVRNEEESGYIHCLLGEIYKISKQRERISNINREKIEQILSIISDEHFSDDFDRGYAKCIIELSRS